MRGVLVLLVLLPVLLDGRAGLQHPQVAVRPAGQQRGVRRDLERSEAHGQHIGVGQFVVQDHRIAVLAHLDPDLSPAPTSGTGTSVQ